MKRTDQIQDIDQLIARIIRGDKECYRQIIERYSPMVFHIIRRYVKDEDEVEELAQQVFVRAYEKLETFGGRSEFSSWLYRLTANHCRDFIKNIRRKNHRFSELDDDYLEINLIDPDRTPYQNVEVGEWKRLLEQALRDLNGDYSEPFLLKYRDGLSYEVMSERLGLGVSALKVRVHRARKELKNLIEKEM